MKVQFTLTDQDIRKIIATAVSECLDMEIAPSELPIQVKSKQNYREHQWETGEIQIQVSVDR